jgi:ComEC/Rec2-related protein
MNHNKNKADSPSRAAIVGFSYFSGIVLTSFLANFFGNFPFLAFAILGALILGLLRKQAVVALTLFSIGAGSLSVTIYDTTQRQPVFEAAGSTVSLTATVEEIREFGFYTWVYTLKTEINGVENTRILLTAPEAVGVSAGDIVETTVTLSELRDSGVFPERSYNLTRGILLKGSADEVVKVGESGTSPLRAVRNYNEYIRERVMAVFPHESLNIGGLLCAVFLGDKSGLSDSSREDIQISGAAHFTAVSGLHMTMIAHMLMLIFALTPWRNNRKVKFAVLLITVTTLAVFFNLTVSVTRAAIMLIVFYGGELFMRRSATVNSMGFALLVILLGSPYAAFDAGLLMSFAGTFGVGVVAPTILAGRKINRVTESFVVSTCAAVCVLPVAALFFGGISLSAPIVSVIILPFFMVAAASMVLFAVTGGYVSLFLLIAGIMSRAINEIISFFGNFQLAWISLDYWFFPFWTGFAIVAVFLIRVIYKNDIKTIKSACLTLATLALMISLYNANAILSERTYITIYSDSVTATMTVRQGRSVTEIDGATSQDTMIEIDGYTILFTRGANDNASSANIIVASGHGFIKRDFDADKIVYVSRSIPIDYEHERNAYFEPLYLILEREEK